MTGAVDTTRAVILRPARRFRIVMACLSAVLVVMSVAALPYNAWLGAIGIAVFAPCLVIFFVPLVHRTSWAAEIDAEGFRVRDFFGVCATGSGGSRSSSCFRSPRTAGGGRGPSFALRGGAARAVASVAFAPAGSRGCARPTLTSPTPMATTRMT